MATRLISQSPNDLLAVTKRLIEKHPDKRVLAFYGKMGVGKTTFIRYFCNYFGVSENVTSPTFALINEYFSKDGEEIYHFDFYRINKTAEAIDIGTEEYFYSGNYCLIEWPEKITEILPEDTLKINIAVDQENDNRIFTF